MVNTDPNRHSLESLHEQLDFDSINIDEDQFIIREIMFNYSEDQLYFDLMEIEDTFYEQFNFRIREKKNNSQLSFYPNYIIYIYNRQYGLESENETDYSDDMNEEFQDMEI